MTYEQPRHVQQRSLEIAQTFEQNKTQILADLQSLELSVRGIAEKWGVNDHNVRRWAFRLGIDLKQRTTERGIKRPASANVRQRKPTPITQDKVRNPALLSMKW